MRRFFLFSIVILLPYGPTLLAQNFFGSQLSNYAGVYGTTFQPANLADNRLMFDVLLGGVEASFTNDYIGISPRLLRGQGPDSLTGDNYPLWFPERVDGTDKYLFFDLNYRGPSLMFAPGRNWGVALTTRARSIFSLKNVEESAARFGYYALEIPEQYGERYPIGDMAVQAHSYLEVGLGLGAVIYDGQRHFLKGGANVKRIVGAGALDFRVQNGDYTFWSDSLVSVYDADVVYRRSTLFDSANANLDPTDPINFLSNYARDNGGWGFDLGLVYEWRPDWDDHRYGVGSYRRPRKDQNKYKLRVGASLLDLGGVTYTNAPTAGNFGGAIDSFDISTLTGNGLYNADTFFINRFDNEREGGNLFRVPLPAAFSLQADYRISRIAYVGLASYLPLGNTQRGAFKRPSQWVLTPRIEGKLWGLSVPVSMTNYRDVGLGAMVRLGPFVAGSNYILSILGSEPLRTLDFQFGVRLYLPHGKPKDYDHDGVPDNRDACRREPGLASLEGCRPVEVDSTSPPTEPIIAEETPSPTPKPEPIPSPSAPEVEEKVTPPIERVPVEKPAISEEVTLPDAPLESFTLTQPPTPDPESNPRVRRGSEEPVVSQPDPQAEFGEAAVPEVEPTTEPVAEAPAPEPEEVAEVPAPAPEVEEIVEAPAPRPAPEEAPEPTVIVVTTPAPSPELDPAPRRKALDPLAPYLPYSDLDQDGIPNIDDDCPDIAGSATNNGCPRVPSGFFKEDAFQSLYFDYNSDRLRAKSELRLETVISYLRDNPEVRVRLAGHTDNSGGETYNSGLSERRAGAARAYLIDRGIEPLRISFFWYGERIPAAPNDTPAGQQLNRRVDVTLEQ